jgi:hypothetical protein
MTDDYELEQAKEAAHWLRVDKRIDAEEDRSIDGGGDVI